MVGERLHRELLCQGKVRVVKQGDSLHLARRESDDRAVQAELQPGQSAQLPGLQAAGAGDLAACRSCSWARPV